MKNSLDHAKMLAGHVPHGAAIIGLYESGRTGMAAMVRLQNGNVVAYCAGVIRRVDQRKLQRKGNRFYETGIQVARHVPGRIVHADTTPDDELAR